MYRAVRFACFGFFYSANHLSGPLRKFMFTCTSSKGHGLWFLIGVSRSVLFVSCFKVRCFVNVLFRGIIDKLSLLRRFLRSFSFLSLTCQNKATSASFFRQKIHLPLRFPSLFLSSLELFSAKLGEHVTRYNEFSCKKKIGSAIGCFQNNTTRGVALHPQLRHFIASWPQWCVRFYVTCARALPWTDWRISPWKQYCLKTGVWKEFDLQFMVKFNKISRQASTSFWRTGLFLS